MSFYNMKGHGSFGEMGMAVISHYGTKVLRIHTRPSNASIVGASVEALVLRTLFRALAIIHTWCESIVHV